MSDLIKSIRSIPDFPKKGIMFRDITTLLKNKESFELGLKMLEQQFNSKKIDKVVGIESRGFIFGALLANHFGAGFVPARKPKKLPAETISASYELEYGTDSLEMHKDAILEGENVLIHDDLLATGGTAAAVVKLVEQLGGNVLGISFLIELSFLNGREKLKGYNVQSVIQYYNEE